MNRDEILGLSGMPAARPMFPFGPYQFYDREYLSITYRTDAAAIRRGLPEPLEPDGDKVTCQWVDMPDGTGFGAYAATALTIPCRFKGQACTYIAQMYVNNSPPVSGGREIWGYPMKYAHPELKVEKDTLTGILDYSGVRIATGTMTYKHKRADAKVMDTESLLARTQVNLKFIPGVDGKPAIAQLTAYEFQNITVKGAWMGDARLALVPSVNAPLVNYPVLGELHGLHIKTDLTLPYGRVIHDYLS